MTQARTPGAVVLGEASVRLAALPAQTLARTPLGAQLALPSDGHAVLGTDRALARGEVRWRAVPDGNRAAVIPEIGAHVGGRAYALCVKGVGAAAPLYGDSPLDFALASDFGELATTAATTTPREVLGESWMGEAPYGAQGEAGAMQAVEVSRLADGASVQGFFVCPTVAVVRIPEELVARDRYWYRRHEGTVVQEHRLVPSNVRLYHATVRALAGAPAETLDAFGVDDVRELDAFVDRYLASGTAALTLWARTLREGVGGPEGLELDDVWLDKDSLVGPDGTLHFADLEALEWTTETAHVPAAARVRRQVDRNLYELLYGLDAVLRAWELRTGRPASPRERRASVADRWELAAAGDPFVEVRRTGGALDLVVRPRGPVSDAVTVRLIDLDAR